MIQKIEIDGVHMTVNDDLRKYVMKKLTRLDKYIPRHARPSTHIEVKLKEGKSKGENERTCEVLIHLPHGNIAISETTVNIYAAVDIVQEKVKTQLHKYKELHADPKLRQRVIARLKRQTA
ncbi:MAG TPA: ribosome-associated translation inhibitor RaiA [Patescibacteria group bacterium]|nr:ribosome-associated translation inhibitor RaiA [Patescibacteria group bacterium]